jgi:transposase InsO family protein
LIQRRRRLDRRRRPGYFRVQRPDQLWHLDMTSVWVAEHGWVYQEFEALDQAREAIGGSIDHYHHRPHSRLNYLTPREVAATWNGRHPPARHSRAAGAGPMPRSPSRARRPSTAMS